MSVAGLCEICEERTVEDGCERCGRLVCERHLDRDLGLCVECSAELERGRDPDRPTDRDRPDGVDTYRF